MYICMCAEIVENEMMTRLLPGSFGCLVCFARVIRVSWVLLSGQHLVIGDQSVSICLYVNNQSIIHLMCRIYTISTPG